MIPGLIGIVTGLVGNLAQAGINFIEKKEARRHELELRKLDLELENKEKQKLELELAHEAKIVNRVSEAKEESAYQDSFQESVKHDINLKTDNPIINGLRASVRPVITYYLTLVLSIILVVSLINKEVKITVILLPAFIELSLTCVLWWFGGRLLGSKK